MRTISLEVAKLRGMSKAVHAETLLMPRRRFTSSDVDRMIEIGLIDPDERIELIHGEIIDMGKEGRLHWSARLELVNWILRRLSPSLKLAPDGPFRLDDYEEPEPDIFLFPASIDVNDVRGEDVLLLIEVADSSLAKDHKIKAPLYADFGVREYWIMALAQRTTEIYRLEDGAYGEPESVAFEAPLSMPGVDEPLIAATILPAAPKRRRSARKR